MAAAIDALLSLVIEVVNYFGAFWPGAVSGLTRISFKLHPIANWAFEAIALAFFGGKDRSFHQWSPTALDVLTYYGLCFLEAFLYGALLGILASVLWLLIGHVRTARG